MPSSSSDVASSSGRGTDCRSPPVPNATTALVPWAVLFIELALSSMKSQSKARFVLAYFPLILSSLFQADAIVLEGGYVVFMVFRGDNTTPTFNKSWSPLHNRCVHLLSKVTEDGVQLFWVLG